MFIVAANTELSEELRSIREKIGLTKSEFARKLGVQRYQLRNWEIGTSSVIDEDILSRARSLLTPQSSMNPVSETFGQLVPVKILGKASAGDGEYNIDFPGEYAFVPPSLGQPDKIHLLIDGDSMMPYLKHGDIASFTRSSTPRNGLFYLVRSEDGDVKCKLIEWRQDGWFLVSTNPAYPEEPLGQWQILGMLVAYYRHDYDYEELKFRAGGLRIENFI